MNALSMKMNEGKKVFRGTVFQRRWKNSFGFIYRVYNVKLATEMSFQRANTRNVSFRIFLWWPNSPQLLIQSIHLVFKKFGERFTCNLIQFEKKAVVPKEIFFLPLFPSSKNCMHNKVWGYAEISTKTLD